MVEFHTIQKSRSLPEVVLEEIQRLIAEGHFHPGDQFPSEMELAERFGVGRSSIREAMRVLQLMGVVEVIQGKGTFVREPGILPLVIDWSRISQMGIISEVMEARQFMEVLLAQLAAERATDEDIESLRSLLDRSEDSISNIESSVETCVDFHLALADAAHNQVLALMYRTIRDLYLETARRTHISSEVAHDRVHDHECLLQAIVMRNPEAAASAMKSHIEKAYQIMSTGEPDRKPAAK